MKDKNNNDTQITLPSKNKEGKIVIKPSPNCDSKTKTTYFTETDVHEDILEHIKNVQLGMNHLSKKVAQAGMLHDKTKIINQDEFVDLVMQGTLYESGWWKEHIREERHHLNENCPLDVNLVDVLEMIVDKVMANKGRKGYLDTKEFELDSAILVRAYYNTIQLVDDVVAVR